MTLLILNLKNQYVELPSLIILAFLQPLLRASSHNPPLLREILCSLSLLGVQAHPVNFFLADLLSHSRDVHSLQRIAQNVTTTNTFGPGESFLNHRLGWA